MSDGPVQALSGEVKEFQREELCSLHGPYRVRALDVGGSIMRMGRCPQCDEIKLEKAREREAEYRDITRARRIEWLHSRSGVPTRFRGRTFANYTAETPEQQRVLKIIRGYAERFEPNVLKAGASLALVGNPGAGKTHLACALVATVIDQFGRMAQLITAMDMLRHVKESYGNKHLTERKVIDSYVRPDLLVLDEVGVQHGSETERTIITEVINKRYNEVRPTVLISNLDLEQLEGYVGKRVLSRMEEGGGLVLNFTWESYRPRVATDAKLPPARVDPVNWGVYGDPDTPITDEGAQ